ncbi:glycosyltransferase [Candidatus Saccharibacteria bacterium]|nr:glycosyltransferase [Candidatus Saccharibacteria bacterium]
MKIAIATAVYYPMTNGVATFSHNLAVGLARRGHDVMVLCPSQNGKNHTEVVDGVRTVFLKSIELPVYPDQINPVPPKKKLFGKELPRMYYKNGIHVSATPGNEIKRALSRFRPDVIHCQASDPVGLAAVRFAHRHNIPLVTTEHNLPDVITDPLKLPKVVKKPVDAVLAAYFVGRQKKSDYVTMPTQLAIEDLIFKRKKNFKVPVEAVSNGVDLSSFKPGKAPAAIYEKYHIPKGCPTALYVGRVDPEKQIGVVLKAFKKVLAKLPEAILVVVGDGVDRANLEKQAEKLAITDSVYFLGRVMPPDLYELYKVGDLFVTASEIETQGIVLIEAAATGLPLVAVDKGAVREVCQDGKNGELCVPKDVDGIAAGILKILRKPDVREAYSKKSLEIAKTHDINRTLERFEEIYQEVLEKSIE